jgi:hypothetical protein
MDRLTSAAREQRLDASPAGNHQLRSDLGQRQEHERPLVHARVRNGQAGFPDDFVAVEQQVQVERARRARERSLAARPRLGGEQLIEQLARGQPGFDLRDRVDEIRLRSDADGPEDRRGWTPGR